MDENTKVTPDGAENNGSAEQKQPEVDIQAALAQSMANEKRFKAAFDKVSSELADLKKKYNAKLSEDEKASIEKAEREAEYKQYVESLEKFKAVTESATRFRALGYSEAQAQKAAEAQYGGDTDEVLRIQMEYQVDLEKRIKAELMKSMPKPSTGQDEDVQMTKEQFNNLSYSEQLKLKKEHPTAYERLAH